MIRRVCLLIIGLGPCAFAQVTRSEVERILKILSADDMMGRGNFNPGLRKATDFVVGEWSGMQPIEGSQSLLHPYDLYQFSSPSPSVILNGQPMKEVIVESQRKRLEIRDSIPILRIGPSDNLSQKILPLLDQSVTCLVLIHPTHEKFFRWAKKSIGKGSITVQPDSNLNRIYVMTEETDIRKVHIVSENVVVKTTLHNVAATIPGKRKNEIVLFSAHLDHIGILTAVQGDSIANGADDNASGVTAVMTLAKYFRMQPKPERTLMFALFSGEELGLIGSSHFANHLPVNEIQAMINIEMAGVPSDFGRGHAYLTGYDRSTLGAILNRALGETKIHPDPYPEESLFERSDNAEFARRGVPAHTLSVTPIATARHYHQVNDQIEILDLNNLTDIVNMLVRATRTLVDGTETPSRVTWEKQ